MTIFEEIYEFYGKDNGYIKQNNFKLIEVKDNYAKIEYEIIDSGLNPQKTVHGGLLFGLADTTAGVAACTTGKYPLTISASINYLKPAVGKKITAIATTLRSGKTVGYYDVKIYNEKDQLVANSNINMFYTDIDVKTTIK